MRWAQYAWRVTIHSNGQIAVPRKSMGMSVGEFREAIQKLGYTQEGFASMIGSDRRTGQKWALGEARIPGSVQLLLRLLLVRPELVAIVNAMTPPAPRTRANERKAAGRAKRKK
jgi:DNA-binding transcriptional regulator YiaG